jgi:O-antigen biosynthesis rhamnosyltransferase
VNVLHVYRTFFPDTQGGLEETIRQICVSTKKHGINSRVLTPSKNPEPSVLIVDEIEVHRVQQSFEIASCNFSLQALKVFREQLEWADLVNYHFPWPFADLLHFSAGIRKPTVITYHSDIVRQKTLMAFYRPLMNRFLSSVNKIICTSPNYFATSEVLSNFENKVEIIPIGIQESSYPTATSVEKNEAKAKWGEDYFLFVGVFRYYKGLHLLLEAAKNAPFKVIIVGSGPIEGELKAQAKSLDLKNVVFTGQVTDEEKVALFANSRAVVFPSYLRTEAFGVTLLEGAMLSKPLISTEIGSGTSHICIDGKNGLVVTPGNAKSLRTAMDQIYYRPEMAKLMGKRSRDRFDKLFTGDLMGIRYANLYHSFDSTRPSTESQLPKKPKWQT